MSRLIDADKFKEYVIEVQKEVDGEFKTKEYRELTRSITKGVLQDLDEQPTAFDYDGVIEVLKTFEMLHLEYSALSTNEYAMSRHKEISETYGIARQIVEEGIIINEERRKK